MKQRAENETKREAASIAEKIEREEETGKYITSNAKHRLCLYTI